MSHSVHEPGADPPDPSADDGLPAADWAFVEGNQQAPLGDRLAALSPDKRALLEQRLLRGRQSSEHIPPIAPSAGDGPAPLSFSQELMWLVHELNPMTSVYNASGARRLHGRLDVEALQRAIDHVVERHDALRTTIETRDGTPEQVVHDRLSVPLRIVDAPGASDEDVLAILNPDVRRPFDLGRLPLMRATLVRIAEDEHALLTVSNHIIWDGWSKGIFFSELGELYDAYATGRAPALPPVPIQYGDFASWQRNWFSGEREERQLRYWKENLAGAPALLELPTDRVRPAEQTHAGNRTELWLPAARLAELKELSRANGVTMFMTLVAAWSVLLQRLSGQDDIVIGTPIAGRNRVELEQVIGYFTNTLALRVDLSGDPAFSELLARVKEVAVGAYANQDVSFERVVREVAPHRDLSHSPVFQSLLVLQNATAEKLELTGLTMEPIITEPRTAKFDLSLGLGEYANGLHASFEYSTDLFKTATVERIKSQFANLLDSIAESPGALISELGLMSADDERELLARSRHEAPAPPPEPLHVLFERQARATPERVAVQGSAALTYAELDRAASAFAGQLRASGVVPGDFVGLLFDRSTEFLVAVLGVLKAGAACVPLDPDYPVERLESMVADAGLALLATQQPLLERARRLDARAATVDIELLLAARTEPLPATGGSSDAAYLLYTSGSTGRRRGVVLEHRGLANHALAAAELYEIGENDRVLQFSSISFDISLEEIFCTLLSGATLVVRPPELPLGGPELLDWLEREQITVLDLPTAFWHEWTRDLEQLGRPLPANLRLVIVGGEKAGAGALSAWRGIAGDHVAWINTYGPTEASVIATAWVPPASWDADVDGAVPIGFPIDNVSVHVLDNRRRLVPLGVPGELYIAGAGLARGYLGQPALTAERFVDVQLPSGAAERCYRTGDIVRRRADGALEFLGRTDDQVKVRGHRIEPREVELALAGHPRVADALVVAADTEQGVQLRAYAIVAEPAEPELPAELRAYLAERLPAYMTPSVVVTLESFPLTPNGKVDRAALPEPERAPFAAGPADDVERRLADVWREVLGVEAIGRNENFFELGGHSMLAMRMFSLVEKEFDVRLPLATLMRAQTISEFAEKLRGERDDAVWDVLVPLKTEGSRAPLFLVHDAGGDVLCYRDLVSRLPREQPAYGLQGVGLDRAHVPLIRIPDMATRYVDELRQVQPHGPYLLAGLCFGGVVAFEMAHQLEQLGEPVALVGLFDAIPFGLVHRTTVLQRAGRHTRDLVHLPPREWREFLQESLAGIAKRTRGNIWWWRAKLLYVRRGRALPEGLHDMLGLNTRAARGYAEPRYAGRVTLFRALRGEPREGDRRLLWSKVAAGGLDVRDIRGEDIGHLTLLTEPHIDSLAAELEAATQAALET